ncbi:MAG: hypothetical protein ACWGPS_06450 [Candidatus Promineifilaceae bacterium]
MIQAEVGGRRLAPLLLRLGFTTILLGYLLVWLPQPVVGLSFIGLEMGEWVKFVPQVRAGDMWLGRDAYYLPPITLGLMLAFWTAEWSGQRWQTWAARLLAIFVAMLSFPALEVVLEEGPKEWLLRLLLVGLVAIVAMSAGLLARAAGKRYRELRRGLFLILGLGGAILPLWTFLAMRPAIEGLLGADFGSGPGVWLNTAGHLLIVLAVLLEGSEFEWGGSEPSEA